jgi:D-lactate dehydrogenase
VSLADDARRELAALFPPERRHLDPAGCWPYASDNSRREAAPDAVVFPLTLDEIVALVRWANARRVPLTPRGLGSNTTGASVPVSGGLVVSLERLTRVVSFRPADRLLVVEAGVTNRRVQEVAGEADLLWPPDPTSAPYATVGGNLATHASGPHAARYGASRRYVLGLTAVTGAGEVLRTGSRTEKHAVGYDLTDLLVGSEGTLAIIVEATLALVPRPAGRTSLRACYADVAEAVAAVLRLRALAHGPAVCELLDRASLGLVAPGLEPPVPPAAGALLLVDVEEDPCLLETVTALHEKALAGAGLLDLRRARDGAEREALWAARRALSPALRRLASGKINEDVAVPPSRLAELVGFVDDLARRTGLVVVSFGHVANGNLHVNILHDEEDPNERARAEEATRALFDRVLRLEGTLSGEHGVGLAKAPYVPWQIDEATRGAMAAIKTVFDPAGLLNPGKILGARPAPRPA